MKSRTTLIAIVIAVAATLVLYTLLHWRGSNVTHDGWGYWQGAISIAGGRGYRYLSGTPIAAWPPLYSLWLAPWSLVLGPTTLALVLGNAVLALLQAAIWVWAIPRAWEALTAQRVAAASRLLLGLYVGCFVGLREGQISAALMVYTLLPLFVLAVVRQRPWAAASLGSLLLLTHSHTLAFVVAGAASYLVIWSSAWRGSALIVGLPLLAWSLVRTWLGQGASHRLVFGGNRGWLGNAADVISGAGALLVPERAGLAWLASAALLGLVWWLRRDRGVRVGTMFVAIAAVGSYALFSLTWVFNPLTNRFLFFVPVVLVSMLWCAAWSRSRVAGVALSVALLLPQAYWAQFWIRHELREPLAGLGYPAFYAPMGARLETGIETPRVLEDGTILLPVNPWEEPVDGRDPETERRRLAGEIPIPD